MNLKLETEFSKAEILSNIDALKKQIDQMRPLPEDVEGRVMQKLRLDWNYHSNAIEGNRLNYGETVAFLMEGITAKGKPLKDHLDIRGHNEAINFLLDIVKDPRPVTEADIRALHKMILVEPYDVSARTADGLPTTKRVALGEYKSLPNHVKTATGEIHYYASPEETPAKMQDLMTWYYGLSKNDNIHPVVTAALFHHKFVSIHPFDDGNGRLSRILMNLILMQRGFPPVVVKQDDRQNYYSLLSRADAKDEWPFVAYIAERLENSLELYLKAAAGDSIDDEDDIDKEIALFKMEMENNVHLKERKSKERIKEIIASGLFNLFQQLLNKLKPIEELFFKNESWLFFYILREKEITSYPKRFYHDDLSDLLEYVTVSNIEFKSVMLDISNDEFKNAMNSFSLRSLIDVKFNDYEYHIIIEDIIIISKFYHENLSLEDRRKVIRIFVESLKKRIRIKIS